MATLTCFGAEESLPFGKVVNQSINFPGKASIESDEVPVLGHPPRHDVKACIIPAVLVRKAGSHLLLCLYVFKRSASQFLALLRGARVISSSSNRATKRNSSSEWSARMARRGPAKAARIYRHAFLASPCQRIPKGVSEHLEEWQRRWSLLAAPGVKNDEPPSPGQVKGRRN